MESKLKVININYKYKIPHDGRLSANTSGANGEGQSCNVQTKAKLLSRQDVPLNIYFL